MRRYELVFVLVVTLIAVAAILLFAEFENDVEGYVGLAMTLFTSATIIIIASSGNKQRKARIISRVEAHLTKMDIFGIKTESDIGSRHSITLPMIFKSRKRPTLWQRFLPTGKVLCFWDITSAPYAYVMLMETGGNDESNRKLRNSLYKYHLEFLVIGEIPGEKGDVTVAIPFLHADNWKKSRNNERADALVQVLQADIEFQSCLPERESYYYDGLRFLNIRYYEELGYCAVSIGFHEFDENELKAVEIVIDHINSVWFSR